MVPVIIGWRFYYRTRRQTDALRLSTIIPDTGIYGVP